MAADVAGCSDDDDSHASHPRALRWSAVVGQSLVGSRLGPTMIGTTPPVQGAPVAEQQGVARPRPSGDPHDVHEWQDHPQALDRHDRVRPPRGDGSGLGGARRRSHAVLTDWEFQPETPPVRRQHRQLPRSLLQQQQQVRIRLRRRLRRLLDPGGHEAVAGHQLQDGGRTWEGRVGQVSLSHHDSEGAGFHTTPYLDPTVWPGRAPRSTAARSPARAGSDRRGWRPAGSVDHGGPGEAPAAASIPARYAAHHWSSCGSRLLLRGLSPTCPSSCSRRMSA